jgi:WD40 repeat protein
VTSLAWDPQGGILASGGIDQTVRAWRPDAASPAWAILASHDGGVWEVVWRPGQPGILASFSGDVHKVRIWDASERNCLHTLPCAPGSEYTVGMSAAGYISFSPDGQQLAAGGEEVRVWRAETGDLALVSQVAADTVGYSPEGHSLAVASLGDAVVQVFGLEIRLKAGEGEEAREGQQSVGGGDRQGSHPLH